MSDFLVIIENGKIINQAVVRQQFDLLNDGTYKIKITKNTVRTDPQRKYYFGTVVPMVKIGLRENGMREIKTNGDAHEYLKNMFLFVTEQDQGTGKEIKVTGSTKGLSTVEFNEYLEEVWQWASEFLSVFIPSPNQQVEIFKSDNK